MIIFHLRGATLQPHSSQKIILTLSHGLYHEAENRSAAIEIANAIISCGRRLRQNVSNDIETESVQHSTATGVGEIVAKECVAHNVAMRLKDADKHFSEDLGECWMDHVDEYQQIARAYKINAKKKLQYLHPKTVKKHRYFISSKSHIMRPPFSKQSI